MTLAQLSSAENCIAGNRLAIATTYLHVDIAFHAVLPATKRFDNCILMVWLRSVQLNTSANMYSLCHLLMSGGCGE